MYVLFFQPAVQGVGAAETIVKGIKYFNSNKNVDLIIIARGGGSLEDLWPFNEQITANAIFESELPIISAVGHETDFTIADFVADLRAPTPSAAGELAVPDRNEIIWKLQNINRRLSLSLTKKVEGMKNRYQKVMNSRVMRNPHDALNERRLRVDNIIKNFEKNMDITIKDKKIKLVKSVSALETLSPLKTLIRGYSIIEDQNGNVIKSVKQLKSEDEVKITLNDGKINARII